MIRLIKRRLIVPRGDTGSFTIPTLTTVEEGDLTEDTITVYFTYNDTVNLKAGKYFWDIKLYLGPKYDEDNKLCGGDEVHSYYAGFELPIFEVREITQNV